MTSEYIVRRAEELDDGERCLVDIAGREVAVFRHDGEFHAYLNWCPHQGGPCCEGSLSGTFGASYDPETAETELTWEDEGAVLNCPWHGWEYDIDSGDCLSRPDVELVSYPVEVRDGDVVVTL